MDTIGLLAAMPSESRALLRLIRGWTRIRLGPLGGIRFRVTDHDCFLVTSGMGVLRAAEATRILIDAARPDGLVSFGIAGAAREDLAIGDVVLAAHNSSLEKGNLSPFQSLASLSKISQEAAEQALHSYGSRLVSGTAVTTLGAQLILQQPRELINPVLEMETSGIVQAAAQRGVPLVVLRSVSDGPRAPLPFDLESIMDDEYNFRPGQMLRAILEHPGILLQSGRMARNSRIAANHAAVAVTAILNQAGPIFPA